MKNDKLIPDSPSPLEEEFQHEFTELIEQYKKDFLTHGWSAKELAKWCKEMIDKELRESEDERIRKWLVNYFGSIKETVWIHMDITCEQILAWLEKQKESLHIPETCKENPDSFTYVPENAETGTQEQKPAEWSEEDKAAIKCIVCCLDGQYVTEAARRQCLEWFNKHRRDFLNRPSWKPSEEQMKLLLNIEGDLRAFQYNDKAKALAELYEQLKRM